GEDLFRVLLDEEKAPGDEARRRHPRFRKATDGAVAGRIPLQGAVDPEMVSEGQRLLAYLKEILVGKHLVLVDEVIAEVSERDARPVVQGSQQSPCSELAREAQEVVHLMAIDLHHDEGQDEVRSGAAV